MYKVVIFIFFIGIFSSITAQTKIKSLYVLDSIHITALTSKKWHKAYHLITLKDTLLTTSTLTDLLFNKTAVFYKEYGRGMIAGISLRGTGTSHTQIVWNGISGNSVLNGQTDLNTFSPAGFETIYIKKGGSSVSFGSGAIGGVLVFEDRIKFDQKFNLQNQSKLGSFETLVNTLRVENSTQQLYFKFKGQFQKSKNDYPYPGYNVKNENGAYQGIDYGVIAGYKINTYQQWYFKSKISNWDRETSRTLYMPENARLKTANQYLLTGWKYKKDLFSTKFDVAWLYESFSYYNNKYLEAHTDSNSKRLLLKNVTLWQLPHQNKILLGNEWQAQIGEGDYIKRHTRHNYAVFFIWSKNNARWLTQLKLRKDFNSVQTGPLTGAAEWVYKLSNTHKIRANVSHNFRLPTFNDLYWQPGGNPDLNPEDSYAGEIGYDIFFPHFKINTTLFYIHTSNLIKWVPVSGDFWQPQNFETVTSQGVETTISVFTTLFKNWTLEDELSLNYHKVLNNETQKLLPFTPQLLGNNNLRFSYRKCQLAYHFHYQGKIYTTTTNTKYLPSYQLHDLSLAFRLNTHWQSTLSLKNIFNTYYETIPSRPLPGRSYEITLNFKL